MNAQHAVHAHGHVYAHVDVHVDVIAHVVREALGLIALEDGHLRGDLGVELEAAEQRPQLFAASRRREAQQHRAQAVARATAARHH